MMSYFVGRLIRSEWEGAHVECVDHVEEVLVVGDTIASQFVACIVRRG
jgi:hypothetical protein